MDEQHHIDAHTSHDDGNQLIYRWHCSCKAYGDSNWTDSVAAIQAGEREHQR